MLTLNPDENPNAEWTIQCGGALTTSADSSVVFMGDMGSPANVLWDIGGAITTGAGSTMIGTCKAEGAITLGAHANMTGATLNSGGAVTLGAGSIAIGNITAGGGVTFGAGATSGSLEADGGHITAGGAVTLGAGARTGSLEAGGAMTLGGGAILLPGNYTVAAALSLTGILTLDAQGNQDAMWIFSVGGALTTAAASKMEMVGDGVSDNVYWNVHADVTLGAGSIAIGTIMADGVVTLGTGAVTDEAQTRRLRGAAVA
jgi:hypothetical protein